MGLPLAVAHRTAPVSRAPQRASRHTADPRTAFWGAFRPADGRERQQPGQILLTRRAVRGRDRTRRHVHPRPEEHARTRRPAQLGRLAPDAGGGLRDWRRDGTVRTWSAAALSTHKDLVVVKSGRMHRPTPVTFCAYSEQLIWTAAADGNVRAYPASGPFSRAAIEFPSGIDADSEISSMAFADSQLISRSTDGMLRIWDTRSIKQQKGTAHPVASHSLPCKYPETQVVLSPTSDFFLTGTQGSPDSLQIFSTSSRELVKSIDVGPAISVCWHPQLNQIFAGLEDGRVAVLYDTVLSRKGALLPGTKSHPPKQPLAPCTRRIPSLSLTASMTACVRGSGMLHLCPLYSQRLLLLDTGLVAGLVRMQPQRSSGLF